MKKGVRELKRNMKRKKIVMICIIFATLMLSACSSLPLGFLSGNYAKPGEEHFMEIKVALETHDGDKLKSMFSSEALSESSDIDDGIKSVLDIPWENVSFKKNSIVESIYTHYGYKTVELSCHYIITTDKGTYVIYFYDHTIDTKYPDKVGIYSIQIVDESTMKNWGTFGRRAGVHLN